MTPPTNANEVPSGDLKRSPLRRLPRLHKRALGARPWQLFRHTADRSKAAALLGWSPAVDFEKGLRRTVEWYTQHEAW